MLARTCLVSLLLLAAVARPASPRPVFGLELTGALGAYHMDAFNDSLRSLNRVTGTGFEDISGGPGWGGNLRLWPNDRLLLRVGLQDWSASSGSRGYTYEVSALAFQGGFAYFLDLAVPVRVGLGLGFDNLALHGGLRGPGVRLKGTGYGFGGHGTIEAMVPARGRWSGVVTLGYRLAKLDVLKLADQNAGAPPDYTGAFVQIGLAFDARPRSMASAAETSAAR